MTLRDRYTRQVRLLVRLLPIVAQEPDFALKGGTAINMFVRDLPRLSVDIDLVFLPRLDRPEALAEIDEAVKRIASTVRTAFSGASVAEQVSEETVLRLLVSAEQAQVKIDVSPVLRGVVHESVVLPVVESVDARCGARRPTLTSPVD